MPHDEYEAYPVSEKNEGRERVIWAIIAVALLFSTLYFFVLNSRTGQLFDNLVGLCGEFV